MLTAIFTVACLVVAGFYLYVLLQFRRECLRTKRKPNSLTYLGSSGGPTILFPEKHEEHHDARRNAKGQSKVPSASGRPAARRRVRAAKVTRNSERLPYLEMALPITAIVTHNTTET
jgi:hypothetical protein